MNRGSNKKDIRLSKNLGNPIVPVISENNISCIFTSI
jgi:hypothetical protein